VFRQPKAGFFAPIDYWLAYDLRDRVVELLSARQVRERGLFRPEVVHRMIEQHRRGARDWSMQIWQLLSLELWARTFLDGSGAQSASSSPSLLASTVGHA
jgi:asparagine synthase (glutamine-hydrolysing)